MWLQMQYKLNKIYSDYTSVHAICREVLAVSDAHAIQSVLIGGSLLGVIRDGDFLPWDKDLDFAVFEADIQRTLDLEPQYRALGYECRVHHLGVRQPDELTAGLEQLQSICSKLDVLSVEYVLINGILLNLLRDKSIFSETDGISLLFKNNNVPTSELVSALEEFGNVYLTPNRAGLNNITLVANGWRYFLLSYESSPSGFGWTDLNCEHRFSQDLFPSEVVVIDGYQWRIPAKAEAVLTARFGDNWHQPAQKRFTQGRVAGSMQLHKQGVMFDFIFHYVRGEKTYWFEPAANVISTIGFLPASRKNTTAGEMLIPDNAEVFLEEHYPNWKVPVKTWDGAVDNPTIIDGDEAMMKILANDNV